MCGPLNLRSTHADGTIGFKDRTVHYELVSSLLLSLIPYGFDDCDTTIECVHHAEFCE